MPVVSPLFTAAVLVCLVGESVAAANPDGKSIYVRQCASCHGASGEGNTDHYEAALVGDDSLGELTELIADTMPEEDPDACVGDDAAAVAQYIYDSFYSPAAQLRNRPARQQLSRLTANQLQQSLADLYQHFYGSADRQERGGLSASYFDDDRYNKKKRILERVDPIIDFDFGREPPIEGVNADKFYITWEGALSVEHTGRYEIVLETSCSAKLHFGHYDHVLIDNHVQSEGKTEFRRTLQLIGGRLYPISLWFIQRKRKTELPPARVSLRWVTPGGVECVIPPENLIPRGTVSTFALQTKLPPDDRTYGYDRGTSVDRQWDDAVTRAAFEFGDAAARDLWPHFRRRNKSLSDDNRERLRAFLNQLVGIAFRAPIDDTTRAVYIDRQLEAEPDDAQAIRRVCLLTLKSPRFLYPSLDAGAPVTQRVANRLSMILHDSLPSKKWLLDEIKRDRMSGDPKKAEARIREVASRMLEDPRLHGKAMALFYRWLEIDPAEEIVKDKRFEGFDGELVGQLHRSLQRKLAEVFWSESSDYRQLFTDNRVWTNQRLASFYGSTWELDGDAKPHDLARSVEDGHRGGVLTHPLLMSDLSYHDTTSPIHRGVFLIRHVLGRTLRPPNEAFTPFNPELHPSLTTRERVQLQTGETKCQVCHDKINGIGFALENYDAAGRYRLKEREKPIDATGYYVTRTGDRAEFSSAAELAGFLADNEDAHRAFIERVFEFFVRQPINAFGTDTSDKLLSQFRASDYNMRKLIQEIAVLVAMRELQQEDDESEST